MKRYSVLLIVLFSTAITFVFVPSAFKHFFPKEEGAFRFLTIVSWVIVTIDTLLLIVFFIKGLLRDSYQKRVRKMITNARI